jgi:hypothetical protein
MGCEVCTAPPKTLNITSGLSNRKEKMKSKNEKIGLVVLAAILAISAFSVIPTPVGAQPVEVWNVTWPGFGTAIATTEDSVYLTGVNTNFTDAFLNKYDSDGKLLWNVTWGGTAGTYSASAAATSGDRVYVVGRAPGGKAFLNRYNSTDGNLLWNRNVTCGGIFSSTQGWATATGDNAVYLTGRTGLDTVPGAFLNKYNSTDGNLIWNITCGGIGTSGLATATSGDIVYLAGQNESSDFDFCNAFLNKYNSTDGSLIWNITWGKTGWVTGRAIATSGVGVVYLAGSKTNERVAPIFANESDAFLVKFSEPTPTPQ